MAFIIISCVSWRCFWSPKTQLIMNLKIQCTDHDAVPAARNQQYTVVGKLSSCRQNCTDVEHGQTGWLEGEARRSYPSRRRFPPNCAGPLLAAKVGSNALFFFNFAVPSQLILSFRVNLRQSEKQNSVGNAAPKDIHTLTQCTLHSGLFSLVWSFLSRKIALSIVWSKQPALLTCFKHFDSYRTWPY